jgi:hypothetical protein
MQDSPWHWAQSTPPVPHMPFVVPARHIPLGPQQPLGHDTASQTQAPLTQCLPLAQAAPAPHWQVPAAEQALAVTASQATQLPPADPHAAGDGVVQVPPAQQPSGQVRALHTQAPPTQPLPGAHGPGLTPQRQAPVAASQRSARVRSQLWQAAPPVPQVASAGGWHTPSVPQQPVGQESLLQPQAPAAQLFPAAQGAPAPQRQSPCAEQLSAIARSHTWQAVPATPQVAAALGEQVEPEQHPLAQPAAVHPLHTPPAQLPPLLHAWQRAPPLPQLAAVLPARQVRFSQQPFGHEVPSHTQVPFAQRWPAAQGPAAPHRHPPADRQRSAVIPQLAQAPPAEAQAASDKV